MAMGILVYSLLWETQDLYHQPYYRSFDQRLIRLSREPDMSPFRSPIEYGTFTKKNPKKGP